MSAGGAPKYNFAYFDTVLRTAGLILLGVLFLIVFMIGDEPITSIIPGDMRINSSRLLSAAIKPQAST
jgi:hypothetical protein